jgi:hypothetical protein
MDVLFRVCSEENLSVLCSLHQVDLALGWAKRLIGLRDGQLVLDKPARRLTTEEAMAVYQRLDPTGEKAPSTSAGARRPTADDGHRRPRSEAPPRRDRPRPGPLRPPWSWQRKVLGALAVAVRRVSWCGASGSPGCRSRRSGDGYADFRRLLDRMLPVEFRNLGRIVELAIETFFIAFIGTALAIVLSIPLAFMAARNTTPNRLPTARRGRSSWRCGRSPTWCSP